MSELIVIGYGDKNKVAGRPGSFCNRLPDTFF